MTKTTPAIPLPAATLLLLNDVDGEPQVFLQQRAYEASFVGGAFVFPGGKLDASDSHFSEAYLSIPEKSQADILFQKPEALPSAIAAIRECFEEAGILLAYDNRDESDRELLQIDTEENRSYWNEQRRALNADEINLQQICEVNHLKLAIDKLVFVGHWITPESSSQRFDTLFFACEMPAFQEGDHDDYESIHSVWWSANKALEEYKNKKIELIMPTRRSLEHLSDFDSSRAFLEHHRLGLSVLER
jgi:8-oxo-dGTP pyrophosphatase MutT (NUDIX family)